MTTAITLRATKGSALTHNEVDANFTNLKATADAAETTANAAATAASMADALIKTAVTTEAIVADRSITVVLGGVTYKILARVVP